MVEITFLDNLNDSEHIGKSCNCLPSCTSITYDIETSQTNFDWEKLFSALKNEPIDDTVK